MSRQPTSPKKSTKAQRAPVKHMERVTGASQGTGAGATPAAPTTTPRAGLENRLNLQVGQRSRTGPARADNPPEEKRGRGRPSIPYDKTLHPRWAWSLAIVGKTEPQIAAAMGISLTTLKKWKNQEPDFASAIKTSKEVSDGEVVASLYKRACGFIAHEDKVTKDGDVVRCDVEIAPDVAACIFWLKNREPKVWRDKQDVNLSGHVDAGKPDLTKVSESELKAALSLVDKLKGQT